MPVYGFKGIDKFGKEISSEVEANSQDEAVKLIRSMGYFPININLKKKAGIKSIQKKGRAPSAMRSGLQMEIRIPFLGIGTVKPKQVTLFTRQLSTLISAGLPLVRSLNILRDQTTSRAFKEVIADLANQVESGGTFSEALQKYPKIFSNLYVNTVKAGEAGGVLEIVLTRLADFSEKYEKLRSKIRVALIYPSLVISFAIGVVIFLMAFVIPKFIELYKDLGSELPTPTLILMKMSNFFQYHWIVALIALAIIIISYKLLSRLKKVKYFIDKTKLKMPIFGELIQKVAIARFARTLGTLISSGVPILQAMVITRDTAGNEVIAASLEKVHDGIREGESITEPLAKTKIFPLMAVNMINVGEETGSVDQMLHKIADTYDEEVDITVSAMTSILEPVLIIFMALIVGFIVISMFLPLIKLLTVLSE